MACELLGNYGLRKEMSVDDMQGYEELRTAIRLLIGARAGDPGILRRPIVDQEVKMFYTRRGEFGEATMQDA